MRNEDLEILENTEELATQERRIQVALLLNLRIIEDRRLYTERGYPSLFAYIVKGLRFSEGSACRRIAATRVIRLIPEALDDLRQRKLTLTTIALFYDFLQTPEARVYAPKEQRELLSSLQGLSKREVERKLTAIAPHAISREREKVLTPNETEIRFVANNELMEKFEKLRSLLSHRYPQGLSYSNLFDEMASLALQKLDPRVRDRKKPETQQRRNATPPARLRRPDAESRRQVRERAQDRCEYIDPTGERCPSRWRLQIDHRKPWAAGGSSSFENLRLLCYAHNRLEAIRFYGRKKVMKYLS